MEAARPETGIWDVTRTFSVSEVSVWMLSQCDDHAAVWGQMWLHGDVPGKAPPSSGSPCGAKVVLMGSAGIAEAC